jgi:hypothetical protein
MNAYYVTTEGHCSNCNAKLTNAETARLNWQGEACRLGREKKILEDKYHTLMTVLLGTIIGLAGTLVGILIGI